MKLSGAYQALHFTVARLEWACRGARVEPWACGAGPVAVELILGPLPGHPFVQKWPMNESVPLGSPK